MLLFAYESKDTIFEKKKLSKSHMLPYFPAEVSTLFGSEGLESATMFERFRELEENLTRYGRTPQTRPSNLFSPQCLGGEIGGLYSKIYFLVSDASSCDKAKWETEK